MKEIITSDPGDEQLNCHISNNMENELNYLSNKIDSLTIEIGRNRFHKFGDWINKDLEFRKERNTLELISSFIIKNK